MPSLMIKTRECVYLSDKTFTLITNSTVQVRGKCKANMKKDTRTMSVTVDKLAVKVENST